MLNRRGPILTLAAGVVLAAVLILLDLNATRARDAHDAAGNVLAPRATATTSPSPSTPPASTAPPSPGPQVTYAGKVGTGNASVAIAVRDGRAVAYLCDGRTAEAWLQGTVSGGTLTMTGANNGSLTATVAGDTVTGTVTAVGRQWTFSVPTVTAPSGLYRAAAQVRGAQAVGGWIVLANGEQVGMINFGDHEESAPALQGTSANLGGTPATAVRLDGTGL
jgi:serine/threonine-protein kinase